MSGISSIGGGASGVQQIMALRQQIIQRNDLLKQLHGAQGAGQAGAAADVPGSAAPAQGFAETFKGALDGVNSVQARSDSMSAAYDRGEVTDVASVMLARQEAGVAFEATLQVRNKLLSAYQDIMRMGV